MRFTLAWLKDHLETDAPLGAVVEALTNIGLEVEHVVDPAAALAGFIVARIIEAKPHLNADRLRVCSVDVGALAPVQVVCGAPNARTGLVGVFAAPGVVIPAKRVTLAKGVIRGVESNGMLCSNAELELSDDHEGIIELPADAPIGAAFAAYAGHDDPVIEINLTPNRPDAASVRGIARDLAAYGLGRLKPAPIEPVPGAFPCPISVTLDFAAADAALAPLVALRLVRGVRNGPSPAWMRARLTAIGLRPINALVDITNYLTFDRGRPLHVFDAAKVAGGLVVRRAHAGESMAALDGKTYALDASMVVIADAQGVESLAGVMGGAATGCDAGTTDVLIESALWDPLNIARTGRTLGLATDARYRFERGVDPALCLPGAELATRMVLDLCGGEASELVIAGAQPQADVRVLFPWSEVKRLTGLELAIPDMALILEKLGFELAGVPGNSDRVFVKAPSWRPDVSGKADLVEEIVRIAGLEKVASAPLPRAAGVGKPVLTLLQRRTMQARRAMAAQGYVEAITYSFIRADRAALFGGGAPALALANPIAADLSDMRPSLLPGLIAAAQRNADRGFGDIALFEVGQVFLGDGEGDQRIAVAAVRRGLAKPNASGRTWARRAEPVDVFDVKGDVFTLLASLGASLGALQLKADGAAWGHPGRSASVQFGPKAVLGAFGEMHPDTLEALGASGPLACFEIILDTLPPPKAKAGRARAKLDLADLMPVERDFAFIVEKTVAAGDLVKAALGADRALIVGADVFDVYEGAGVEPGRVSIGLSVTLQPRDKTLTEVEIDAVSQKIVADVAKKTGGVLRA